ncbi:hypothetical protein NTG1052_590005 [Candidatus Nitrotoga sp. 1052]|nr:hypothetical protein NTG1052_590005 [Candidatus Nitrotoga sp. 1052]
MNIHQDIEHVSKGDRGILSMPTQAIDSDNKKALPHCKALYLSCRCFLMLLTNWGVLNEKTNSKKADSIERCKFGQIIG